jgi:small subunit ribosomal protein S17e
MDFIPEESAIKTDVIKMDHETIELLAHLNMPQLLGVL